MSSAPSTRLSAAQRREQILTTARHEFQASGFAGSRVQDVADAAGVTSALIYKHFESKEELFEAAVMAPLHEMLAQRIEEIRSLPSDPEGVAQLETTQAFMRTLLNTFSESIEAIGVVLFGDQEHARSFYTKHVRPLIDASVEASRITMDTWPHRDYDIATAMSSAFGMAFWVALDCSMREIESDLDAVADQLADILFLGISAREGGP